MRLYLLEYNAGYNQPPPYVQQHGGYAQYPAGYAQHPTGYAQQSTGYAQQPTGYAQQPTGFGHHTNNTVVVIKDEIFLKLCRTESRKPY